LNAPEVKWFGMFFKDPAGGFATAPALRADAQAFAQVRKCACAVVDFALDLRFGNTLADTDNHAGK